MRSLLLLVPLLVVVRSEGDCDAVKSEHNVCAKQAYETYVTAMKLGPTWANYRARKTCNFLTEAIDVCGNKLLQHGCHSEEEVTTMKDSQLSRVLENIGQSVADFDSCKCPAAKAHIDRMKAREGLGVEEECPSESAIAREEYYRAMEHFWRNFEFEDILDYFFELPGVYEFTELIGDLDFDFDFGFIGGAIVATGVVLGKHFVLALF